MAELDQQTPEVVAVKSLLDRIADIMDEVRGAEPWEVWDDLQIQRYPFADDWVSDIITSMKARLTIWKERI
jgi:hypothetical protein